MTAVFLRVKTHLEDEFKHFELEMHFYTKRHPQNDEKMILAIISVQ